jgi:aryl-alcohol dehydrogenase-like predicted oxidoreductase
MRYRPFGISGKVVSALSLLLRDTGRSQAPGAWRTLAVCAMECGINAFELEAGVAPLAAGFREAMEAVERRLLFVAWRIIGDGRTPTDGRYLREAVREGLNQTGSGYFDLLTLDEAAYATLTPEGAATLDDLRAAGLALQIGVAGVGDLVDQAVATGAFDALGSPFNLTSGWHIRRRIREAAHLNMSITGFDAFPPELCRPPAQVAAKAALFRRAGPSAATVGVYAFLHETRNWAADELCLAYALTEPALACVQIEAHRPEVIERLAAVPDRELPTGLAAQIEMARIDTPAEARSA